MPPLITESKRPAFGVSEADTSTQFNPGLSRSNYEINRPGGRIYEAANAHTSVSENTVHAATLDPEAETGWEKDTTYGHIVKPKFESLWGYKAALRENGDLKFAAHTFGLFDGIIAKECGLDAKGHPTTSAFNPNDEFHSNYAPLRRNLAILRDYLLVHYPPSGKDGEANIAIVQGMAKKIGEAMNDGASKPMFITRWSRSMKRLFTGQSLAEPSTSKFIEFANTPDRGISYMYEYLHDQQNTPSFMNAISFSGKAPRNWKLPELKDSPFSGENIVLYSRSFRMERVVDSFDSVVGDLHSPDRMKKKNEQSVDTLGHNDKKISVEEAHKILKNLRINLSSGRDEKLVDNLDPKVVESQMMLKAALCYRGLATEISDLDPQLLNDPKLKHADTMEALEKIDYRLKVEQQQVLAEDGYPDAAADMAKLVAKTPDKYKTNEPIDQLLQKLDEGITRASELQKSVYKSRENYKRTSADLSQQAELQQFMSKGRDTMSSPKISAISDPSLIPPAAAINMHEPEKPQKDMTGGQNLGGK